MVTLIQSAPELTIMIVEHDMDVIFTLADRVTVLHYGRSSPRQAARDPGRSKGTGDLLGYGLMIR
jgi:ABC-type branched-subunit amino acid transport system ATPase component